MTPARQKLSARQGIAVVAFGALAFAAVPALAIEPAAAELGAIGPPVAGPPVAEPAKPAIAPNKAPAPAGAKPPQRDWLRSGSKAKTGPAPAASAGGSSNAGRMALLCGLVAVLAGGAWYMKRRRRVVVTRTSSELSVVTAAKVGTKADVVVVSVGGRRLLLGVTEAQVSRLAWLDGEPDPEEFEGLEPYVPMKPAAVAAAPRSAVAAPSATRVASRERSAPGTRGFRDALRTALGRNSSVEDPAVAIAAATEDVVLRSPPARVAAPAGAPEMVDVEGQARGLVLRLQKRG